MNLSGVLEAQKITADSIDVSAEVTLGPAQGGGFEISGIAITLRASIEGVSAEQFAEWAETAIATSSKPPSCCSAGSSPCPLSKACGPRFER